MRASLLITVLLAGSMARIAPAGVRYSPIWSQAFELPRGAAGTAVAAADGSVLVGYHAEERPCIFRISPQGDRNLSKCYDIGKDEPGEPVAAPDGGFFLYGYRLNSPAPRSIWLLRADAQGKPLWMKLYDAGEDVIVRSVIALDDGGAAIAGGVGELPESEFTDRSLAIRVSNKGDVVWTRVLDSTGGDFLHRIATVSDGFIVAGGGENGPYVAKLSGNGAVRWTLFMQGGGDIFDLLPLQNGSIVVAGNAWHTEERLGGWIAKLDASGRLEWELHARDYPSNGFGRVVPGAGANEATVVSGRSIGEAKTVDLFTIDDTATVREQRSVTIGNHPYTSTAGIQTWPGGGFVAVRGPAGILVHTLDGRHRGTSCFESGAADLQVQFARSKGMISGDPIEFSTIALRARPLAVQQRDTQVAAGPPCSPVTRAAAPQPVASSPALEAFRKIQNEHGAFMESVRRLLLEKNFAVLDQMSEDLRKEQVQFRSGWNKLDLLFAALVDQSAELGDEASHIAKLVEWRKARPQSAAAAIALGRTYITYAQHLRGGGYASTVTESAHRAYLQRLAAARTVLEESRTFASHHPEYHRLRVLTAGCERLHATAFDPVARELKYFEFFSAVSIYLTPRWCGSREEYRAYAEYVATAMDDNDESYALLAWYAAALEDEPVMTTYKFDWQRVRRGFHSMIGRFSDWIPYYHRFALMAEEANDRATARDIFARPQTAWYPGAADIWPDEAAYRKALQWANTADPYFAPPDGAGQEWPAIALSNHLKLKNGTEHRFFNSFLIETPSGVLAATAFTVYQPGPLAFRAAPIATILAQLRNDIASWTMSGPTGQSLVVTDVVMLKERVGPMFGGILLAVRNPDEKLPVQPLKPRREPIPMGTRIYLVACRPQSDPCRQVVHQGTVPFRYNRPQDGFMNAHVAFPGSGLNLRDFIGSPVLDDQGFVAGLIFWEDGTDAWHEGAEMVEIGALLEAAPR